MANAATLPMTAAAVQGDYDGSDPPYLFIVLGLVAFIGLAVLVLKDDGDGDIDLPGLSPD